MKTVCLDARKIEIGGIGTYLRNLLKHFSFDDLKMTLLVPPTCNFQHEGIEIFRCGVPDYSIQEQVKLPFIIPKCDLFWTPHFNIPLFPIRAKKRLVTLPDVFHLAQASRLGFLERMYAHLFTSQAIAKSDQIITVSEFSKRELLRLTKARESQITVIPNGVDGDLFYPTEERSPRKYFLFVGNQKTHKNLKGVLEGFSHFLSETKADCDLLIVGSGKGLRHVEDVNKWLVHFPDLEKRVKILGHVPEEDLSRLYAQAFALVFPSLYEGFGLPPLEAMSAGCPAIVSKIPSLEEVCKDAVYYVEPLDSLAIAQGMQAFWREETLRKKWIEKGKEHAKTFLWKETAQKHLELIRKLLQ